MDNQLYKNQPQAKEKKSLEDILEKQNQAFSAALPEARKTLHKMAMASSKDRSPR